MLGKIGNLCPVCGYELDSPAYEHGASSFEICPCCGHQFGYDDSGQTYASLRKNWIANGMRWWSTNNKPEDWNPEDQLSKLNRKLAELTKDKEPDGDAL